MTRVQTNYGLLAFLGLLAFVPLVFLFPLVAMFALLRAVLLLAVTLPLAVLLLVEGVPVVLELLVDVELEVLALLVRLVLAFPLLAFSVVQAALETRSVNTARAKIFLIIVSFKAAASVRGEIGKHPDRSIYHTLLRKS
jgi:hypothetical protein